MHAFVADAGVRQNAKVWQCNVAVDISEGFRQLLIVRCGCSPFRDLQNSVNNGSQQPIKRRLGGGKNGARGKENEVLGASGKLGTKGPPKRRP